MDIAESRKLLEEFERIKYPTYMGVSLMDLSDENKEKCNKCYEKQKKLSNPTIEILGMALRIIGILFGAYVYSLLLTLPEGKRVTGLAIAASVFMICSIGFLTIYLLCDRHLYDCFAPLKYRLIDLFLAFLPFVFYVFIMVNTNFVNQIIIGVVSIILLCLRVALFIVLQVAANQDFEIAKIKKASEPEVLAKKVETEKERVKRFNEIRKELYTNHRISACTDEDLDKLNEHTTNCPICGEVLIRDTESYFAKKSFRREVSYEEPKELSDKPIIQKGEYSKVEKDFPAVALSCPICKYTYMTAKIDTIIRDSSDASPQKTIRTDYKESYNIFDIEYGNLLFDTTYRYLRSKEYDKDNKFEFYRPFYKVNKKQD